MVDLADVLADLRAEGDALDALVDRADRTLPTPAVEWTIGHQIAHLAWTDGVALLAVTDPRRFAAVLTDAANPYTVVDDEAAAGAADPHLMDRWRAGRAALAAALANRPTGERIPWFGPAMSPASMATARLMETWAHGQDVADALGVCRPATARLRHVAHLGVRTRDFAFTVNALPVPPAPIRVELLGPAGERWTWGPDDAAQRVTGSAVDFALLVTRRRHRRDLAVHAVGADAQRWLDIAQAFAGPPGPSRAPGQFT